MTEWHPTIASMVANHYIESEEFQFQQAQGLGRVLLNIIVALKVPPDPTPTTDDDPLLFGAWRESRVLAAIAARQSPSATPSSESRESGSSDRPRRRKAGGPSR